MVFEVLKGCNRVFESSSVAKLTSALNLLENWEKNAKNAHSPEAFESNDVQFVAEEKLFMGQALDPLYVIGFEGFWGMCIFGILLPIFQQIECTGQLCHGGRLEDSVAALQDFKNHPILIA
jgi:hypothetical protein